MFRDELMFLCMDIWFNLVIFNLVCIQCYSDFPRELNVGDYIKRNELFANFINAFAFCSPHQ